MEHKNLCEKGYTIHQALEFSKYVYESQNYLDVHCLVFSPDSIKGIFDELNELGVINVEVLVSEDGGDSGEFLVEIVKIGEPEFTRPNQPENATSKLVEKTKMDLEKEK